MKHSLLFATAALALAGCAQPTPPPPPPSGAAWLAQYRNVPVAPPTVIKTSAGTQRIKSIDQLIRDAAAVEPVLKFPARIGLARLENGGLINIPPAEAEAWQQTRDRLGARFGEFIPVSPLVTEMMRNGATVYTNYNLQINGVVDQIRLGAARQHLDAVLIYEVHSNEYSGSNALTAANLSIIGGFILPSHYQDGQGYADGVLIDVVQGYPYDAISAVAEKETRVSSSWGWGSDYGSGAEFSNRIKTKAAVKLAEQAYDMFTRLAAALPAKAAK